MSGFVPYVDRNQSSGLSVTSRPGLSALRRGPVGKTFHRSTPGSSRGLRKPLDCVNNQDLESDRPATPRKCLVDLNLGPGLLAQRASLLGQKTTHSFLKPSTLAVKDSKQKLHQDGQVKKAVTLKQTEQIYAEKENMPIMDDIKDTYEDIWAAAERPDTYIQSMKQWRPSQIFPCYEQEGSPDDLLPDCSDQWESDLHVIQGREEEGVDLSCEYEPTLPELPPLLLPPTNGL